MSIVYKIGPGGCGTCGRQSLINEHFVCVSDLLSTEVFQLKFSVQHADKVCFLVSARPGRILCLFQTINEVETTRLTVSRNRDTRANKRVANDAKSHDANASNAPRTGLTFYAINFK